MFPDNLKDFRDYVHSFYGKDGIYDYGFSISDIEVAIVEYVTQCLNDRNAWGGGDSVDRERVRDIVLDKIEETA